MIMGTLIIGCLLSGIAVHTLFPVASGALSGWTLPAILSLMLLVGFQMGSDLSWVREWKKHMRLAMIVSVCTVVGSLFMAWCYSLLDTALRARDAMLVASGMSFYSLSSILLNQEGLRTLSVLSLLSNLLREVLSLAAVPLIVKLFGVYAPIAATASGSDSGAPVITRVSGKEYTVLCVICAFILSICVPVLTKLLIIMG